MPLYNQAYGNLMSYKVYVRPAAHSMYGYTIQRKSKHQQNALDLLQTLFVNGSCTTWEMAKNKSHKITIIRNQEKIFRRLLVGRTDRARYSGGILDSGLVVKEKHTKPYSRYRLSLYGILYCLDTTYPRKKDIDVMTSKYAFLLPKIFGRWKELKSILGSDVYNLQILAKTIYLNNLKMARTDNPLYELMSFIHIKYRRNFESISEVELAEQISYWFYTFLLYRDKSQKLKNILASDAHLQKWYMDFFNQAKNYYIQRLHTIKNFDLV